MKNKNYIDEPIWPICKSCFYYQAKKYYSEGELFETTDSIEIHKKCKLGAQINQQGACNYFKNKSKTTTNQPIQATTNPMACIGETDKQVG